jgi:putative SOS response-associated peptidase YedK
MCGRAKSNVNIKKLSTSSEVVNVVQEPPQTEQLQQSLTEIATPGSNLLVLKSAIKGSAEKPFVMEIAKWGFPMAQEKLQYNSRIETYMKQKNPKSTERCVIVVDAIYEKGNTINRLDNKPLFIAALSRFDKRNNVHVVSIITTDSKDKLAAIHHRQPLILNTEGEYLSDWILHKKYEERTDNLFCGKPEAAKTPVKKTIKLKIMPSPSPTLTPLTPTTKNDIRCYFFKKTEPVPKEENPVPKEEKIHLLHLDQIIQKNTYQQMLQKEQECAIAY